MIYVQIGLYAEGRSDYDLLLPLIGRLLADLVARRPETFADLPDPIGIDAPGRSEVARSGLQRPSSITGTYAPSS